MQFTTPWQPHPALLRAASASPSSTECTPPTWERTEGKPRAGGARVRKDRHLWPMSASPPAICCSCAALSAYPLPNPSPPCPPPLTSGLSSGFFSRLSSDTPCAVPTCGCEKWQRRHKAYTRAAVASASWKCQRNRGEMQEGGRPQAGRPWAHHDHAALRNRFRCRNFVGLAYLVHNHHLGSVILHLNRQGKGQGRALRRTNQRGPTALPRVPPPKQGALLPRCRRTVQLRTASMRISCCAERSGTIMRRARPAAWRRGSWFDGGPPVEQTARRPHTPPWPRLASGAPGCSPMQGWGTSPSPAISLLVSTTMTRCLRIAI